MQGAGLNGLTEPIGSVDAALAHAKRLLEKNPDLAAEQAREILNVVPAHPLARLILGAAQRRGGRASAALEILEPLAREQPQAGAVHLELGVARAESGFRREAIAALRHAVQLQPAAADGWRLLADHLEADGDAAGADACRVRFVKAAAHDPRLTEPAKALAANDLPRADRLLRAHLERYPTDVAALRMLAEVAGRLRLYAESQELLERCLALAPSFEAARQNYAAVLNRQAKPAEALPQAERLLASDPANPGYLNLKAAILANLGDYRGSIAVYQGVLERHPRQPKVWMSLGHALKTEGRHEEAVSAYRRAISMQATLGEAFWSMANLKTFRFTAADVAAMRAALISPALPEEERVHFEFALGKALEDARDYAGSFAHYERANALHRRRQPYPSGESSRFAARCKREFTRDYFQARRGAGASSADPIFIVGLPRAGSTLIEQILASHPAVEGTIELPDIPQIARELVGRDGEAGEGQARHGETRDGEAQTGRFFEALAELDGAQLCALGERYLESTRVHRKRGLPFFVDKMPNNCLYVGLIHLILPNARIVDARRHPLGCCFSAFKQHFARGQGFTYSLADLGRYYRDYVELMSHFDTVLPGRVHRVLYESMVEDTEAETRRLLEHCGLPFEERCLRFYENERPVRTASSEQVRQPIFKDGVDHWRHFEPWLEPLKRELGPVLERYPHVPECSPI
jgi:tetratricopeptide (TPR) repeat protein